jgi:hypothetical protein
MKEQDKMAKLYESVSMLKKYVSESKDNELKKLVDELTSEVGMLDPKVKRAAEKLMSQILKGVRA